MECDGSKSLASNHTISEQTPQKFDAREMYLHLINYPCFKSVKKRCVYSFLSVPTIPFSKLVGYISVFKIYRFQTPPAKKINFQVNGRPAISALKHENALFLVYSCLKRRKHSVFFKLSYQENLRAMFWARCLITRCFINLY